MLWGFTLGIYSGEVALGIYSGEVNVALGICSELLWGGNLL
ncbi:MAG TPA: hypothetical protein PLB63_07385 [Planctomycetota bacterium]|nr:hypothetical protein [Planctomycetota bacterium]HQB00499.1 hypothetical protein [Planctomycetota bacterium]